jgi:hypothetical protein
MKRCRDLTPPDQYSSARGDGRTGVDSTFVVLNLTDLLIA